MAAEFIHKEISVIDKSGCELGLIVSFDLKPPTKHSFKCTERGANFFASTELRDIADKLDELNKESNDHE
ncbi:hypothetical protein N9J84_01550 [Porticoccaceae bacterium]|nr:hypothetical protein [Porticoccaceae bacterium]